MLLYAEHFLIKCLKYHKTNNHFAPTILTCYLMLGVSAQFHYLFKNTAFEHDFIIV